MSKYIASTLAGGVDYAFYDEQKDGSGVNPPNHVIQIQGGAGVARKGGSTGIITKEGVLTQITDEDLERLKTHELFKVHQKNGFVKIIDSKSDAKKAVKDLNPKDASKPLTEKDYKPGGRAEGKAPTTGKVE